MVAKVKCVTNHSNGFGALTVGKEYEVLSECSEFYHIRDDKGREGNWDKSRFVIATSDPVSHPAHYTLGKIEVYDFIKAWDLSFAEGNVVKYVVRAPHKGKQLQDLKKARWYLDQLIKEAEANG